MTLPAQADRIEQVFKSGLISAIDGSVSTPFYVSVEGRCIDGYVQYKIVNFGEDWPNYSYIGIFREKLYYNYAKYRLKMKKGETKIIKVDFKGMPPPTLEFVIKPHWLKQSFRISYRHIPPDGWGASGKNRARLAAQ